jgi:SAM-dependent methyltransferase
MQRVGAERGEIDRVRESYARRRASESEWNALDPAVHLPVQEKERAMVRVLAGQRLAPLSDKRVLEIGCGTGDDLLSLIRLGFEPANMVGCELLEHRARAARHRLPEAARVICGDATEVELPPESFDVVMQSTVFTSLLDAAFQKRLADRMWALLRPGGGVLWFDFVYDNPRNPDVRGVPLSRIRELFPQGTITTRRLALAPPIARRVTAIHPALYGIVNLVPALRTHVLCWIGK